MKFFYAGRLGHTILSLPLYGLRMIVAHSPPNDPWLVGESLKEIIKRIAHLECRDIDDVTEEVRNIRSNVDDGINTSSTAPEGTTTPCSKPTNYHTTQTHQKDQFRTGRYVDSEYA